MKHNQKNWGFPRKYLVYDICKLSWNIILTEKINNQTGDNSNDDGDRNSQHSYLIGAFVQCFDIKKQLIYL